MPWPVSNSVEADHQNQACKTAIPGFGKIQRSPKREWAQSGIEWVTHSTLTPPLRSVTNSRAFGFCFPESGCRLACALAGSTTAGGVLGEGCCPACLLGLAGRWRRRCGHPVLAAIGLGTSSMQESGKRHPCQASQVPVLRSASGCAMNCHAASTGGSPHSTLVERHRSFA